MDPNGQSVQAVRGLLKVATYAAGKYVRRIRGYPQNARANRPSRARLRIQHIHAGYQSPATSGATPGYCQLIYRLSRSQSEKEGRYLCVLTSSRDGARRCGRLRYRRRLRALWRNYHRSFTTDPAFRRNLTGPVRGINSRPRYVGPAVRGRTGHPSFHPWVSPVCL